MNTINIFDWDDNILCMPSIIKMERKSDIFGRWFSVKVSTEEFKKIRDDDNFRFTPDSLNDFKDDELFLNHTGQAINKLNIGPSFLDFQNVLMKGKPFAIITARGHSTNAIKLGILMIIRKLFNKKQILDIENKVGNIENYINNQKIYTTDSSEFVSTYLDGKNMSTPEKKYIALTNYIETRIKEIGENENIRVFFSDDDISNVKAASDLFENLKISFPDVSFIIYDTSTGNKKEIAL
jgi:hypothetical protein